jgi:type I restriction enzyme S subunit
MIDLSPEHLDEVRRILAQNIPLCKVLVFGSRVTGRARCNSDLDLLVLGSEALNWRRIEQIKDAFSESDLPFMVDVLDGHDLCPEIRQAIAAGSEVIQEASWQATS